MSLGLCSMFNNDICCICLYYYVKDLALPKTESSTDAGEVTAATWIFYAAIHEAIGHRPSVSLVNFYSSGPSSVMISPSQKEHEEEEDTAMLSTPETLNSEFTSAQSSTSHVTAMPGEKSKKEMTVDNIVCVLWHTLLTTLP